jgi:hypothetical protein
MGLDPSGPVPASIVRVVVFLALMVLSGMHSAMGH